VFLVGPLIALLQQVGWVILLLAAILLAAGIVYRIRAKKERVTALQSFVDLSEESASFVVFDTETSGLRPEDGARIVQIALIAMDENLIEIGRFSTIVNPHGDVGRTDIHGITRFATLTAPDFHEISRLLFAAFNNKVIVAHNADFDERFIRQEFSLVGLPMPSVRVLDTLSLARKNVKGALNYKLMTLVSDLAIDLTGSPPGGAHDALYDAWCCAEVLKSICARYNIAPSSFINRN
jgi:DNA polymerase-3 subunit epsilon